MPNNSYGYDFSGLGSGWGSPTLAAPAYNDFSLDPMSAGGGVPGGAYGFSGLGAGYASAPPVDLSGGTTSPSLSDSIFGSLSKWVGTKEAPGPLGSIVGVGQSLLGSWMGMQQYGLAKQKLAESKRQFDQNYAAQRTITNADLADRQRARVASNPGAYQSVGDYMNQNGVK